MIYMEIKIFLIKLKNLYNKYITYKMKYIISSLTLLLSACNHCIINDTDQSHSCPKSGHGPCFLCDDPLSKKIAKK